MKAKAIVPIIIGTGIIFFGTRSGSISTSQSDFVTNAVRKLGFLTTLDFYKAAYIVRKAAHMFEYCIFAGSASWAIRRTLDKKASYMAFIIAVMLAGFDEIMQFSQEGRIGCATDVLIDSLGAAVGICLYNLFRKHD